MSDDSEGCQFLDIDLVDPTWVSSRLRSWNANEDNDGYRDEVSALFGFGCLVSRRMIQLVSISLAALDAVSSRPFGCSPSP